MAQDAPSSIDMLDIQFKIHDRFVLFNTQEEPRSNVNLLAVSSSRGLLFAGNPHAAEFKVIIIKDLIEAKEKEKQPLGRLVPLPCAPNMLACSADGNLLAINYTQNASGVLDIYSVQSCTSAQVIRPLHSIRLSPDEHVHAVQLLWNPVLPNSLAVVLSNGGLGMYALKDGGNFEFHSIDKSHQVKCGCWSPKGKQIVLGFPNGKLQQFKPDLTPAKTIVCPPNVHGVPFDTIALHWLSTYQFAVIFLQHGEDCTPSLYVINAPKAGTPSYINYYDICYSGNGPRNHQFNFTHVPQWNLLLVTSANGVEVGLLGTTETGDAPSWIQYTLLDEARIEMPLSESNDETFPMGFVYDTSSTHHLVISENKLPTMPMIHVLTTDGTLICLNFLNLRAGAASVCSPPPPIADTSGQFRALDTLLGNNAATGRNQTKTTADVHTTAADISFAFPTNAVTSTPAPAKDKPVSFFGASTATTTQTSTAPTQAFGSAVPNVPTAAPAKPAVGFGFGSNAPVSAPPTSTPFGALGTAPTFGNTATTPSFGGFGALGAGKTNAFSGFGNVNPVEPKANPPATAVPAPVAVQKPIQSTAVSALTKPTDMSKPVYTIPPTYTPPTIQPISNQQVTKVTEGVDTVIQQIMTVQISAFNEEIEQLKQQTNAILSNIGNPNEIKSYTKRLNDLQEINEQANDHDFELDLQNLRHTLNESYAMLTECRTKLQIFKNPDMSRLMVTNNFNATSRRQLNRLKSYVAVNETQLQHIQQQIDMQWEHYQDVVRRSSDTKMRLPCLEGIYQRMTKLQNTLSEQRIKMNFIKTKLKEKGLLHDVEKTLQGDVSNSLNKTNSDSIVETLAESILSMTLSQTVDSNHSKLTTNKLQAIRQAVQQQKIRTIKPQRPDRVDLKSEVILETKLKSERQMRERQAAAAVAAQAAATVEKEQKAKAALSKLQAAPVTKPAQVASPLTKFVEPTPKSPEVNMPFGAGNTAPNFAFGKGNSFVKPIAATGAGMFAPEAIKTADTQNKTNKPAFGGFGTATGTSVGTSLSFGKTTSAISTTTTTAPVLSFGAAPLPSKPISGSENLFAGIGNNLSITKVSTSQAATTPKETKTFEFTPTAQAGATNNNKSVTKTEEAAVKPFQANTFFGSSLAPAVSGQPSAPSASGSSLNFGGFGSALGLGTTSTFNFNAPVTTSAGNTLTKSISGKNLFGDIGKPTGVVTATNPSTASIFGSTTPSTSSSNTSETASEAPSVVSVSSTVSATSSTKPASTFSFGGTLPVSTDSGTASSTASVTTSISTESTSSFTFGGVTSTVGGITSATPASVVSTSTTTAPMPSATDVVDKMLDSVTICKPTVKGNETAPAPAPAFGGFSVASSGASNFSFGTSTSAASDPFKSGLFASNTVTTAPSTVAVTATVGSATAAPTTTSATTVSATTATTALPSANSFSFTNALSNLSTGPAPTTEPAVVTSTAPVTTTTSTAPTIMTATTAVTATSTPSIFGSTTPTVSAFQTGVSAATGSVTTTTPSIFGSTATAASGSIFGPTAQASANTPSSAPSGNIFGGIPKPEQSVFGNSSPTVPATGLFASAAAANPSPFSSPTTAGGGSIFGGGGGGVAATTVNSNPFGGGGGSIFGGATNTNTTSPFGGNSVFGGSGGAAVKSPSEAPTNIFGTPTNQTAAAPAAATGSIFGQSAFGQTANAGGSGGSLFGSTAAATSPAQQPTNAFGNTGSIFGGGASSAANSGGSIFGNASSNTNAASAFGSNSFGSFSSPAGGGAFSAGGGAFAQGGASVAQSGFGSPQQQQSPQQQSNAFAKPVFGGAPTFGSPPPAFGASPTFGGAATFGNPKGFGSFTTGAPATNPVSPPGFGAPTQKNSLFETLGSTDSGLSFGNLAQSANVQKPAFGGSSFMNYRA